VLLSGSGLELLSYDGTNSACAASGGRCGGVIQNQLSYVTDPRGDVGFFVFRDDDAIGCFFFFLFSFLGCFQLRCVAERNNSEQ